MGKLEEKNRNLFANYKEIREIVGKLELKMSSYNNSSVKKLRSNGLYFNKKNTSGAKSNINFASSSTSRPGTLNNSYEEQFRSPNTNASHNPIDLMNNLKTVIILIFNNLFFILLIIFS